MTDFFKFFDWGSTDPLGGGIGGDPGGVGGFEGAEFGKEAVIFVIADDGVIEDVVAVVVVVNLLAQGEEVGIFGFFVHRKRRGDSLQCVDTLYHFGNEGLYIA